MSSLMYALWHDKDPDMRVHVVQEDGVFKLEYYSSGNLIKKEDFPDKHLSYVVSAAENWAEDIKVI